MPEIAVAPPARFTRVAKTLHWVTAFLVILPMLFGFGIIGPGLENMTGEAKFEAVTMHASAGLIVLVLTVFRLLWRRSHPAPPYPDSMPAWQRRASKFNVRGLYTLLLVQPLLGIAQALTYVEFDVQPFRAFNLTALAPSSEQLTHYFHVAHGISGFLLALFLMIHIAAAFKHLLVDRDKVFQRMWPFARV